MQQDTTLLTQTHLRYITASGLGITRKKLDKGFTYIDDQGNRIKEKDITDRINSLGIPTAWTDIWIAPVTNAHLQAIGKDAKGRKQYIYHPLWNAMQQQHKFNKIVFFAEALPEIRAKVAADMQLPGLPREKVIATLIWIMEHTFIRVGNQEYAKENKHFGLTTLRNKHVQVVGDKVAFSFIGKSGKEHTIDIYNPKVARIIKKCIELPGYELFQYLDEDDKRHVIDSGDVNEYLKRITGGDITAKDFRTWGGTLLAAISLYTLGTFTTQKEAQKNITQSIKTVSQHLRNTPNVCRSYYIHPTIIDTYQKEILIPHFQKVAQEKKPQHLSLDEYAVITLLQKYPLPEDGILE